MAIWAIGDPHLSFGTPDKKMDVFGDLWKNHPERFGKEWHAPIQPEDLVLVPGDISWAMRMDQALPDLEWIDALPGTKVMIKGNHDFWWSSISKVRAALPPSIHVVQNDAFSWKDVAVAGSRLWDCPDYGFLKHVEVNPAKPISALGPGNEEKQAKDAKIYQRELQRLEISLKAMNPNASLRIVMCHYPPIGADLVPSEASQLMSRYNVDVCVFGHLHSMKPGSTPFGTVDGVKYVLCSCDTIDFTPVKIRG